VSYAGKRLLFSGDIEGHAASGLLARGTPLQADVLKVPHHGSRTSSSDAFLRAVSPSLALISAGAVNPFGHPHAEVVQRLRDRGARIIDLGKLGGTIVTLDDKGMRVDTLTP
jgi:competence protein ComEC